MCAQQSQVEKPLLEITLAKKPKNNNFKRFLLFRNQNREQLRFPIYFKKKKGLVYRAVDFPDGLDAFGKLMQDGNRSFWDNIWLENRRGKTDLEIERIKFVLDYNGHNGSAIGKITFIDSIAGVTLKAGMDKIRLNRFAYGTKYKAANLQLNEPEFVRLAIRDIGKFGSDELNPGDADNPKYGKKVKQGSPSFVAWYYHSGKIKVGRRVYNRKKYGDKLLDFFKETGRVSGYEPEKGKFISTKSKKSIEPKTGDFLQEKGKGGMAMLITHWDKDTRTATAVAGPSPVIVRKISFEKGEKGTGYWLGSI